MKTQIGLFATLLSFSISSCDSQDMAKFREEKDRSASTQRQTGKGSIVSSESTKYELSEEEKARWIYDNLLISSFDKQDEPLIMVLESLRAYCKSVVEGPDSNIRMVFEYRFDPQYSFRKISVSVNTDGDREGTIGELMSQIEAQLPIKLKPEGNVWVFENAPESELDVKNIETTHGQGE